MKQRDARVRGEPCVVDTGWRDALFYCRKCARKSDGGFGPDRDEAIKPALRAELRARGLRGRVGVVGAACFGVCPEGGVTVMRASRPGRLMVVDGATLTRLFDGAG